MKNFMLISSSWKTFEKMHQQKAVLKKNLTNIRKSEKGAYFHRISANNFCLVHFL
jgi:hypothetical protein